MGIKKKKEKEGKGRNYTKLICHMFESENLPIFCSLLFTD